MPTGSPSTAGLGAAIPASRGMICSRSSGPAGSMAKDSVFNAASVIRKVAGIDAANYDVHVNVIGGGLIDGPSAGLAVVLAVLSAIQGKVKQVGGIPEKIYGARQAGMRKLVIPEENRNDVPSEVRGIEIVQAATVENVLAHVFAPVPSRGHSSRRRG